MTDPAAPTPAPLRILLVEDDELIRLTLAGLLEALGHTVVRAAADGFEAVACLADGATVDLVILDFHMPGLDGLATLARLRALRPGLPAILASGSPDLPRDWDPASASQPVLLAKPYSVAELQGAFRRLRQS